jgi:hypothetical protein
MFYAYIYTENYGYIQVTLQYQKINSVVMYSDILQMVRCIRDLIYFHV